MYYKHQITRKLCDITRTTLFFEPHKYTDQRRLKKMRLETGKQDEDK